MSTHRKGERTIDVCLNTKSWVGGLGCDLKGLDREELLGVHGRVSRAAIQSLVDRLDINANEQDVERLCYDLDSMRITVRRKLSHLDELLALVEVIPAKIPNAQKELSRTPGQPLNLSARLAAFSMALSRLDRACEKVKRTKVWEAMKLTWHDDAILVAMHLDSVARRERRRDKLNFFSDGPTTKFIADALQIAGIQSEKQGKGRPITADGIKHAFADHPQMRSLQHRKSS